MKGGYFVGACDVLRGSIGTVLAGGCRPLGPFSVSGGRKWSFPPKNPRVKVTLSGLEAGLVSPLGFLFRHVPKSCCPNPSFSLDTAYFLKFGPFLEEKDP